MQEEIVYNGWLKVARRQVGHRSYDILLDYDAVSAVVTNPAREILLIRQFRPAVMKETLEIPAGTMDNPRESKVECLIRELKEETGLTVPPNAVKPVLSYLPNVGFSDRMMSVFQVELKARVEISPAASDEDVSGTVWLSFREVGEKISTGEILDVKTIIGYLHLNQSS
jgi:ADP-ribose pyrophosphatase